MKKTLIGYGVVILLIAAVAAIGQSAFHTIRNDNVQIGQSSSTGNKSIIFDNGNPLTNPIIRWNRADSKLQFSNDGSMFQDIGSGSGGGGVAGDVSVAQYINILQGANGDCETGTPPENWTASAGAFVANTATPGNGLQACQWTPTTADQTLRSDLVRHPRILSGRRCTLRVQTMFVNGDGDDVDVYVESSTGDKLSQVISIEQSNGFVDNLLIYTCPLNSIQARVVFEARTNIGGSDSNDRVLIFDDVELGQSGLSNVSQAEIFGSLNIPRGTNNCSFFSQSPTSSTAFTPIIANLHPACNAAEVSGGVSLPATGSGGNLGFKIDSLPPGRYQVVMNARFSYSGQNATTAPRLCNFEISVSDQTENLQGGINVYSAATQLVTVPFDVLETRNNLTFGVVVRRQGATNTPTCRISALATEQDINFTVYKYPLETVDAVTIASSNFFIDAEIGGDTPVLAAISQANYRSIDDPDLDLVVSPGSAPAEIACVGGTPPSGLTCNSSNVSESVGVAFSANRTGLYRVCFAGSHFAQLNQNVNASTSFRVVETPLNATSILQTGRGVALTRARSAGGSITKGTPFKVCGLFTIADTSKKMFRLFYNQEVTGGTVNSTLSASRSVAAGSPVVHVTVVPVAQNVQGLVSLELRDELDELVSEKVNSTYENSYIESARIDCGTGPSILEEHGDWITSVTSNGAGRCNINIIDDIFPRAVPLCTFTPVPNFPETSGGYCIQQYQSSGNIVSIRCRRSSDDALANIHINVMCR